MSKSIFCLVLIATLSQTFARGIWENPPPSSKLPELARYVVHKSDWTSMGTISTQDNIKGFPFVGIKSVSDGDDSTSTGVPYLLASPMDVSIIDVDTDNKLTLFFTLAQNGYCQSQNWDPQDPRCARVMLTGSMSKVMKGDAEYESAKTAMITRHPAIENYPENHNFYFGKIEIQQIAVIGKFGGVEYVDVDEYKNADLETYMKHVDSL